MICDLRSCRAFICCGLSIGCPAPEFVELDDPRDLSGEFGSVVEDDMSDAIPDLGVDTGDLPKVSDVDAASMRPDPLCDQPGSRRLLRDPSFEVEPQLGLPRRTDIWSGDLARRAGVISRGLPAFDGLYTLEFLSSINGPRGGPASAAQVWQLVSLPGGVRSFHARARFARTDQREPGNRDAELWIQFFEGELGNFPEAYSEDQRLADVKVRETIREPSSWQVLELRGEIPEGSQYAAFELRALEETINRVQDEFRGFYVDDACFSVEF